MLLRSKDLARQHGCPSSPCTDLDKDEDFLRDFLGSTIDELRVVGDGLTREELAADLQIPPEGVASPRGLVTPHELWNELLDSVTGVVNWGLGGEGKTHDLQLKDSHNFDAIVQIDTDNDEGTFEGTMADGVNPYHYAP